MDTIDPEMQEKPCRHCGKMFKPKKWWAKFCSKDCRWKKWDMDHARRNTRKDRMASVAA